MGLCWWWVLIRITSFCIQVLLKTTLGEIDVELWSKETPLACRNFVQLCMEGYYNGTIFHRVVRGMWLKPAYHCYKGFFAIAAQVNSDVAIKEWSLFLVREWIVCLEIVYSLHSANSCLFFTDFIAQGGDPTGTGEGTKCPDSQVLYLVSFPDPLLPPLHFWGEIMRTRLYELTLLVWVQASVWGGNSRGGSYMYVRAWVHYNSIWDLDKANQVSMWVKPSHLIVVPICLSP